jgi:large subunit ribosomal protein L7e
VLCVPIQPASILTAGCSPHSISQKDIEVPETILKKQKANQKVNDQRAADTQKKRDVR